MQNAAVATLAVIALICGLSFWMGRRAGKGSVEINADPRKLQFGIGRLLGVMTLAALSMVTAGWFDESTANAAVVVFAIGAVVWSWFHDWDVRAKMGSPWCFSDGDGGGFGQKSAIR